MKIVLDTNVLLVSISRKSKDNWILQRFLNEDYTLCVTHDILLEYEEIIARHMSVNAATEIINLLLNAPTVLLITRYYQWNYIVADVDDNKFVDCAIAANATFIVSEDRHFDVLKQIPFPKVEVKSIEAFRQVFFQA
jgi:putative PIN family toxin of toxin-antitoxin system